MQSEAVFDEELTEL